MKKAPCHSSWQRAMWRQTAMLSYPPFQRQHERRMMGLNLHLRWTGLERPVREAHGSSPHGPAWCWCWLDRDRREQESVDS